MLISIQMKSIIIINFLIYFKTFIDLLVTLYFNQIKSNDFQIHLNL